MEIHTHPPTHTHTDTQTHRHTNTQTHTHTRTEQEGDRQESKSRAKKPKTTHTHTTCSRSLIMKNSETSVVLPKRQYQAILCGLSVAMSAHRRTEAPHMRYMRLKILRPSETRACSSRLLQAKVPPSPNYTRISAVVKLTMSTGRLVSNVRNGTCAA